MSSVWGMRLQWGSTIIVSIELPAATGHRCDMTEKLLKGTLNLTNNNNCQKDTVSKKLFSCNSISYQLFMTYEPSHDIMALFVLRKHILQMRMRSHPLGLDVWFFGQTLRLLPYFMCVNSEGSGETARMRRLAWAFAGHLCDISFHRPLIKATLLWNPYLYKFPYVWILKLLIV